jgi:glycosyltransferase involved in cell wall biosynthesis
MKLGIDAKWFFDGPPSGRVVIENLVKNIIMINNHNRLHCQLHLFFKECDKRKTFPYYDKSIHCHYIRGKNNFISNVLFLPLYCIGLKLDVVICQNFSPFCSSFKRISYIHDIIYVSHPEFFTITERLYFFPIKFLARRAHRICTISESEKRRLINSKFGTDEKIDVIHHGITDEFKPKEQHSDELLKAVILKYNLPEKFILYVGRLNLRKNILNLVKSIPLLEDRKIPLFLAGQYDWKTFNADDLACRLGIKNRIILTGFVENEYLPVLYALSTIFCFVSYEEGFGLPVLEAMATGVPVVVSNSSSIPEVCGDAGNYVDPHDPQSIATTIDSLLNNEELYAKKRTLGLKRASFFKWRHSAEKIIQSALKACST